MNEYCTILHAPNDKSTSRPSFIFMNGFFSLWFLVLHELQLNPTQMLLLWHRVSQQNENVPHVPYFTFVMPFFIPRSNITSTPLFLIWKFSPYATNLMICNIIYWTVCGSLILSLEYTEQSSVQKMLPIIGINFIISQNSFFLLQSTACFQNRNGDPLSYKATTRAILNVGSYRW